MLVTALVTLGVFWPPAEPVPLPAEPRVDEPAPAGEVLRAGKLFARGSYWDDGARYVFVEPKKVIPFKPVELEVPGMQPPKIVMPLPDPGPLLKHSDSLPRSDGSVAPAPAPAPAPAKAGGAG